MENLKRDFEVFFSYQAVFTKFTSSEQVPSARNTRAACSALTETYPDVWAYCRIDFVTLKRTRL
jgi:hypothetical protein